jgi:hypothetical protein
MNAHHEPIPFLLPGLEDLEWHLTLDTADEAGFLKEAKRFASGEDVDLRERSACLLKLTGGTQERARQESWKKRPFGVTAISGEEERAARKKT